MLSQKLDTKYLVAPDIHQLIQGKRFLQSKGIILVEWSHKSIISIILNKNDIQH